MSPGVPNNSTETTPGELVANLLLFARTLRAAGLPVGPGQVLDALTAVQVVGLANRSDFYWALHAVLVRRREQRILFDQAFHIFWRNPQLLDRLLSLAIPGLHDEDKEPPGENLLRRLAEALGTGLGPETIQQETDATGTWSKLQGLADKDFEQMSQSELQQAKALLQGFRWRMNEVPTRRFKSAQYGSRIDLRKTLRQVVRSGGGSIPLHYRRRSKRPAALVLLCDVSGSMSRYSRMLLHFAHTLSNQRDERRTHTFVFGTQLRNITRQLLARDVDQALDRVAAAVNDWEGGTCIGAALHAFNRDWSRRVLGQGADVLFISDGLDREGSASLGAEMERLHKSCRHLIWLNPLLRYREFQPKATGIRALLPHVDDFRPAHNVNSLIELADLIARPNRREEDIRR